MKKCTIEIRFRNPGTCAGCGGDFVVAAEITCVPTEERPA
jgi:hypothetical protein